MVRYVINPKPGVPGIVVLPAGGFRRAKAEITAWPGYAPTPLQDGVSLAGHLGVASVAIKDEAGRFGLGSFKALGGAYAAAEVVLNERARRAGGPLTLTCATDGNHGRSVAWGAQRMGERSCIFVHEGVDNERVAAIEQHGAEVRRAGSTYDESVRVAGEVAAREGWFVVSDTSWPGYTEVPRQVMQGYRILVDEALDQWAGAPPTHVFVQAGVGGLAAAVAVHLRARLGTLPTLIVVEPDSAACLLASAQSGGWTAIAGPLATTMDCLACGEPSLLAWQELGRSATAFLAIGDDWATEAVHALAALNIESQPSGAAGLAGLLAAAADPDLKAAFALDGSSRVLLFNTEGGAA
ncbi:MAG: diaminopropionate ammonia-lyase [Acetobacteraceae bacterium]|nr:diaminopropionate ammonia-lyase [Acetobacteraceae bacterium]